VTTVAILTAAGSGTRLGRDEPKALVTVAGVPLVVHAARRLARSGVVDAIIVTAPEGLTSQMSYLVGGDEHVAVPVGVVVGGDTRQESVAAGIAAIGEVTHAAGIDVPDIVLVHDAARPFASTELIRRVAAAVGAGYPAVVPGLPVVDTVKAVSPLPEEGLASVVATPDRAGLRAVQTPQGFDRELLTRAHAAGAGLAASDDAGLVEALGEPVVVVPGEDAAMKITTEADLHHAEFFAGSGG
jgi:2-C-methyl-D-erythritol 4-phosphate cytidylyltransferase